MEVPFSWPNHAVLPKTPLSKTITLGFRISTYGFWKDTNGHGILWNQRIIKLWFKEGISSIPLHLPLANAGMKLGWKMFWGQVQWQLACAFLLFVNLNGKFQNHFLSDRNISPHLPSVKWNPLQGYCVHFGVKTMVWSFPIAQSIGYSSEMSLQNPRTLWNMFENHWAGTSLDNIRASLVPNPDPCL